MTTLGPRFAEAFRYAADLHATQTKKGTDTPYVSHLMAVAGLVLDDGGTEDEAIAALLHDAVEDQGGLERLEDIRHRFGDTVAHVVEGCSDSFSKPKPPWIERKRAYVTHARDLDPPTLRVSAADKVVNASAILRDWHRLGDRVFARFNAGRDDLLWYYAALVDAYRQAGGGPLVDELARVVTELKRLARDQPAVPRPSSPTDAGRAQS
jgi:GTP pyrophosphokinase